MARKRKDAPGQLFLEPNSLINRRLILRRAKLPTVHVFEGGKSQRRRTVKPAQMIAVIHVLVDHGAGCWLRMATIADESRLPRNVVMRAVAALANQDLIALEKHPRSAGGVYHQYSVNWAAMALLCPENRPSTVPTGDSGLSPVGASEVSTGDSGRSPRGTPRSEKERVRDDLVADELGFPDFAGCDLAEPTGVSMAIDLLHGIVDDEYRIALAAVIAVRKGRKPTALFVKLLRDGWGKFPPADSDHAAAKELLNVINGVLA